MPAFLVPLHEFNKCHNPEGAGGGRFCSGEGGTTTGDMLLNDLEFLKLSNKALRAMPSSPRQREIQAKMSARARALGAHEWADQYDKASGAGELSPPVVYSGGGTKVTSYGKVADALLARLDERGGRIGINFGTTGKRSSRKSKNHFGMGERRAAEKLEKAGVIKITRHGTSPYKPRPGSWRTAWASDWTLERV